MSTEWRERWSIIVEELEGTAHWRADKSLEYPEDRRNLEAEALLTHLAIEVADLAETSSAAELHAIDLELDRLSQGNKRYDLSGLFEECNDYRRRIGFSEFPMNGQQYLNALIRMYRFHRDRAKEETSSPQEALMANDQVSAPRFVLHYSPVGGIGVSSGNRGAYVPPPREFDSLDAAKNEPVPDGLTPSVIQAPDGNHTYSGGQWQFLPHFPPHALMNSDDVEDEDDSDELIGPPVALTSPATTAPMTVEQTVRTSLQPETSISLTVHRAEAVFQGKGELTLASSTSPALYQEMLSRTAVLEEMMAELKGQRPSIGHNNPPEPIEGFSFDDNDREAIDQSIAVLKAQQLAPVAPTDARNAAMILRVIGERLWTDLVRIGGYSAKQADIFISETAKSAGAETGKRLVQLPFWLALAGTLMALAHTVNDWLGSLLHSLH